MRVSRQDGIALMLVLWVLTLLTVMAVGLTAAQRTETTLTDNHVAEARLRALGDAAIAYAMWQFSIPPPPELEEGETVWQPNGVPRPWRFAGTDMMIAVFNEASRLNLNETSQELLASLFIALEVPEEEANALAAAIVDWRDEDDLKLLNGAEDDDYEDAGRVVGAKDEPFVAVEELQQVLGMTPGLYRRVAPELTVEGEGKEVVEEFASAAVIAALQGISLEEAELRVAERDAPQLTDGEGPRVVNRGGPLYRIQITQGGLRTAGRRLEALVEMTPGLQSPYRVRWRRFGLIAQPPAAGTPPVQSLAP